MTSTIGQQLWLALFIATLWLLAACGSPKGEASAVAKSTPPVSNYPPAWFTEIKWGDSPSVVRTKLTKLFPGYEISELGDTPIFLRNPQSCDRVTGDMSFQFSEAHLDRVFVTNILECRSVLDYSEVMTELINAYGPPSHCWDPFAPQGTSTRCTWLLEDTQITFRGPIRANRWDPETPHMVLEYIERRPSKDPFWGAYWEEIRLREGEAK